MISIVFGRFSIGLLNWSYLNTVWNIGIPLICRSDLEFNLELDPDMQREGRFLTGSAVWFLFEVASLTASTMIKLRINLCNLWLLPFISCHTAWGHAGWWFLPCTLHCNQSIPIKHPRYPSNATFSSWPCFTLVYSWWDCAGCDWETGQGWCSQVGRMMNAEVTVQYRATIPLFRIRIPDYRTYGTGTSFLTCFPDRKNPFIAVK